MNPHGFRLKPLGIDTQREYVIYMRCDCHVCRAEGFKAQTRLEVALRDPLILVAFHLVTRSSAACLCSPCTHRHPVLTLGGEVTPSSPNPSTRSRVRVKLPERPREIEFAVSAWSPHREVR